PFVAGLALVCVASAARAGALDPFAGARGVAHGVRLDPFRRLADAAPAGAPSAARAPQRQSCQRDEDCSGKNICQQNVSQPIQLRTNIAYLYYREGNFTE